MRRRETASERFNRHRKAIRSALVLGLDVESQDPNMKDSVPRLTNQQVDWIASWLTSEGIGKLRS